MKHFVTITVLVLGGVAAWRIGETLSSDAISMGLGIFFGMLAGVPAALMVMAASRRREYVDSERSDRRVAQAYGSTTQPPVIVVSAPGMLSNGQSAANGSHALELPLWSSARSERQFKVVGEQDELVDEW
jgi:hypothetical protein